ncbi:SPOR domain-containing protein [Bacteroidota bacterium]
MLDFGKYIKELLLLHDCVILPGLGGFVANYKPAEFDAVRNTVNPPSKHILFNSNLVHNDGLLYAHVSKAMGHGYKDTENMAQTFIDGIRRDTRRGMKFTIGGLGYFYADGEGQIMFSEEAGNNYLLESYGLPLLQYREFEKQPIPETYRSIDREIDPIARQRRIRRWAYGTAAACLVTAMILVPIKTGYFNQAGIDIPTADSFRKEQPVNVGAEEQGDDAYHVNQAGLTPASKSFLINPEYHIIVGSFKDFGNARQLRNQVISKGYEARILCTQKSSYRVTAGTYTEKSEASVELAFVLSDYDEAWVLSN